jgi:hypothetical protein
MIQVYSGDRNVQAGTVSATSMSLFTSIKPFTDITGGFDTIVLMKASTCNKQK